MWLTLMTFQKKKRVKMLIRKYKKPLGTLLLLFFSTLAVFAQVEEKSDCVIKLEQAQTKYNQGRIQDVEPLISQCIESGEFNKADQSQALKLLTLSYIFLKEIELAESTMLRLLETNHEFQINEAVDPSEFINLYNKYRTDPVISIGILGGVAIGLPIIKQLNSATDINEAPRQKYTPQIGFRVGLNTEYKLTDKWYANPGINYSHIAFVKTNETQKIISSGSLGGFTGELNFNIIELPLVMQYQFLEGKVRPYATAGIVPQFYSSAYYPGDGTFNKVEGSPDVALSTLSLNKDLKRFNLGATLSGGIKIKVPAGFINARVRYSYGLFKVFKESSSLDPNDPNLTWDLFESLDGFSIHDLSFSIGYTYHVFMPKKLR